MVAGSGWVGTGPTQLNPRLVGGLIWVGLNPKGYIPLRCGSEWSAQIERTTPTHFDAVSAPSAGAWATAARPSSRARGRAEHRRYRARRRGGGRAEPPALGSGRRSAPGRRRGGWALAGGGAVRRARGQGGGGAMAMGADLELGGAMGADLDLGGHGGRARAGRPWRARSI